MCGFQDAMSNIMPVDWFDPYGRTPFAKDSEMSVDITIVETDDGIRATSVKNPPKAGPSRMMDAIKNALGVGFMDCMDPCSSQQAADLGKRDDKESQEKSEESQDSDIMESSSSGDSKRQGSQPWSDEKSPKLDATAGKAEDAKEKAPKF